MLARLLPHPPTAVPLIPNHTMRAVCGAARPPPLHGPALQELCEEHRLVPLARGEHEGPPLAASFGPPVDFGPEPAPAPAEGFGLWGPCCAPAAC
jgi:hypothetical protein